MNRLEARQKISAANAAIALAVELLRGEMPTIEWFLRECASFDSVVPVLDPKLFNNDERRVARAAIEPLYTAARDFMFTYEAQIAILRAAAARVGVKLESET